MTSSWVRWLRSDMRQTHFFLSFRGCFRDFFRAFFRNFFRDFFCNIFRAFFATFFTLFHDFFCNFFPNLFRAFYCDFFRAFFATFIATCFKDKTSEQHWGVNYGGSEVTCIKPTFFYHFAIFFATYFFISRPFFVKRLTGDPMHFINHKLTFPFRCYHIFALILVM